MISTDAPPTLMRLAATRDARARRLERDAHRSTVPRFATVLDSREARLRLTAAYAAGGLEAAREELVRVIADKGRGRARTLREHASIRRWAAYMWELDTVRLEQEAAAGLFGDYLPPAERRLELERRRAELVAPVPDRAPSVDPEELEEERELTEAELEELDARRAEAVA